MTRWRQSCDGKHIDHVSRRSCSGGFGDYFPTEKQDLNAALRTTQARTERVRETRNRDPCASRIIMMSHYQQSFNRRAQMRIDVETKVERYMHHCPAEMPSNVLSFEAIRAPVPRFVFALPVTSMACARLPDHLDPSHYSRMLSGIAFRTAVAAFHQFAHRKS
jgi:hypothetical protein